MSDNLVERQRENTRLMENYFALFGAKDFTALTEFWHDEAVFESAFAPENFPSQIHGGEKIVAALRNLADRVDAIVYSEIKVRQTIVPEQIFVNFHIKIILPGNKSIYESANLVDIKLKNNQIIKFKEYFNPVKYGNFLALLP